MLVASANYVSDVASGWAIMCSQKGNAGDESVQLVGSHHNVQLIAWPAPSCRIQDKCKMSLHKAYIVGSMCLLMLIFIIFATTYNLHAE